MSRIFTVNEIKNIVAPIAKSYGIKRVYLFGSFSKGNATIDSDVDLHVEKGEANGLKFIGFAEEVENALGLKTDVVTTQMLSEEFLKTIQDEEVLIYESN